MTPAEVTLVQLYQQLYELTEPECRLACRCPQSCCSAEYCEIAIVEAKREWGVELTRTNHPRLPLMGPLGCTAAPHLRRLCTLHTCAIASLGFKPKDASWTEKYYALREKISEAEYERTLQHDFPPARAVAVAHPY